MSVAEDLGGPEVGPRGEGVVLRAHELDGRGGGGGHQRRDTAEAEPREVWHAVGRGERAQGAMRERAHLVQVADDGQAARWRREMPRPPRHRRGASSRGRGGRRGGRGRAEAGRRAPWCLQMIGVDLQIVGGHYRPYGVAGGKGRCHLPVSGLHIPPLYRPTAWRLCA
jgi:hypothetical protein